LKSFLRVSRWRLYVGSISDAVCGDDVPTSRIKVLTVDDHPVLRDGLAAILGGQDDMEVIGEAANGEDAVAQFVRLRPDVTLMDLQMPGMGGIEAIEAIRRQHPSAKIMVLTTYEGDVQAVRALKAGASGYLLKSSIRRQLVEAIRTVHAGKRFLPPDVAQEIAMHAADEPLSRREIDVLRGVAAGKANKQVAWELSVSEDTIKAHMKTIFAKLDVADRTHAVMVAMRRGYFEQ
jgi:DNA-binding NarL/FixJ family response regulator